MSSCPPDTGRDGIGLGTHGADRPWANHVRQLKRRKSGHWIQCGVEGSREGMSQFPNTMMKSRFLETTSSTKRESIQLPMIE
jgi:hypothetical protein